MVLVFYQDNTEVIDSGSVIVVDPRVQISGLANSYPEASTPLADDDKLIVRQGNDWKEVAKSELGGEIPHVAVDILPQNPQPNTIYFEKSTGTIWFVDENGVVSKYGGEKGLKRYLWHWWSRGFRVERDSDGNLKNFFIGQLKGYIYVREFPITFAIDSKLNLFKDIRVKRVIMQASGMYGKHDVIFNFHIAKITNWNFTINIYRDIRVYSDDIAVIPMTFTYYNGGTFAEAISDVDIELNSEDTYVWYVEVLGLDNNNDHTSVSYGFKIFLDYE